MRAPNKQNTGLLLFLIGHFFFLASSLTLYYLQFSLWSHMFRCFFLQNLFPLKTNLNKLLISWAPTLTVLHTLSPTSFCLCPVPLSKYVGFELRRLFIQVSATQQAWCCWFTHSLILPDTSSSGKSPRSSCVELQRSAQGTGYGFERPWGELLN